LKIRKHLEEISLRIILMIFFSAILVSIRRHISYIGVFEHYDFKDAIMRSFLHEIYGTFRSINSFAYVALVFSMIFAPLVFSAIFWRIYMNKIKSKNIFYHMCSVFAVCVTVYSIRYPNWAIILSIFLSEIVSIVLIRTLRRQVRAKH
jgi:hypothetical protein